MRLTCIANICFHPLTSSASWNVKWLHKTSAVTIKVLHFLWFFHFLKTSMTYLVLCRPMGVNNINISVLNRCHENPLQQPAGPRGRWQHCQYYLCPVWFDIFNLHCFVFLSYFPLVLRSGIKHTCSTICILAELYAGETYTEQHQEPLCISMPSCGKLRM